MPSKMSITMNSAVAAIKAAGGSIYPEKGGWWLSKEGHRISFPVADYRGTSPLGTNTVFAMVKRGLLEELPEGGNHIHSAYRLKS